ncbi:MAG: hypothetical protein ACLFTA_03640 [Candidatus Nanohaloarchaea archaeon]
MIVGFNIDSMDASKDENSQGNLQVNYRPEITEVNDTVVSAFDEKVARIEFEFTVSYEAGGAQAAHISMSGNVLWKGNTEEIMDEWEENEDLPEEVSTPLMNELYRRLLSESVGVASTLGLLPPIPTPKVGN